MVALFSGCASQQVSTPLPSDPKSILVLLPKNNSLEVDAPHTLLANVSQPLADRGYYVFPVAVMERFMRENGLHSGAQMHAVPLFKFQEHIAPDAVLYITINQWGQKFQLLQSAAVVDADLKLVDTTTGDIIWSQRAHKTYVTGNSDSSSLTTMVIGAVVDQVAGSLTDHTDGLSRDALGNAFNSIPEGERLRTSTRMLQGQ